jgi:hypothetical protein
VGGATDELLALWRTINNLLGRFYLWFAIAAVVIGGVLGWETGVLPGAAAGAAVASEVGLVLLISLIAAETLSIGKASRDLDLGTQSDKENE